ncbi:helix-turn-helix transcriptional regulator [bacterium]|nr:helix-turn-helix transcriptional regulator [bacterium]
MKTLKDNLNKLLKQNNMTLTELSRKSKVPKTNLHSWTTGANPQLDQLKRVCAVLEVPLHEMAFGESDPFEATSEEILKEIFTGDVRVTLHRIEKRKP